MPIRFEVAKGEPKATGAIFDVDVSSGRVKSVERIKF
jgi:calcineurin-like phosphoesterase